MTGRRRAVWAAPVGTLLVLLVGVSSTSASVSAGFVRRASRVAVQRASVLPARAALGSALASSRRVSVTVGLTPRDPAALAALAAAVSDPSSASYHHYLTSAQFAARFGVPASSVRAVTADLTAAGLHVSSASSGGLSLTASGTAAQIQAAFGTRLQRVTLADGTTGYANTTAPTLPAGVADLVQGVVGLDSLPVVHPAGLASAHTLSAHDHATRRVVRPQVTASGSANDDPAGPSDCSDADTYGPQLSAYTAQQMASAYGMDDMWADGDDGAGVTVAVAEFEPYGQTKTSNVAGDVAAYQSCYGTDATVTDTGVLGGARCGSDPTCGLEDDLDIEDIIGLAPGATINVYEAPNNAAGIIATLNAMIISHAPVISYSWGQCEPSVGSGFVSQENTLFQKAAVQGESVFAAAGDHGADDCGNGSGPSVDDPASQPYVTGVGGTSLPMDANGNPEPDEETAWNDADGAGGGGVSSFWTLPGWQADDAISQSATSCPTPSLTSTTTTTGCREVPDVSIDADPNTGYVVYDSQFEQEGYLPWVGLGGTSAAAPTWAALAALADASSWCTSRAITIGFANPTLYTLDAGDFYDVTSGNNGYDGIAGYSAQAGYDMASGLGAPNGAMLVPGLCDSAEPTTITTATTPPTTTTTATTTTTTATTPTTTTPPPAPRDAVRYAVRSSHTIRVGTRVHLRMRAYSRLGLRFTYSARRLPPGLHIARRTGIVSGRPRRAGNWRSMLVATDSRGNSRRVIVRWTVRGAVRHRRRTSHHTRRHHRRHHHRAHK